MIKIESHNVELDDFTYEVHSTLDNPNDETFTVTVVFVSGSTRIANTIPASAYIKGTWTDEDVENAIQNYIKSIEVK
jgi:hypothetical protein